MKLARIQKTLTAIVTGAIGWGFVVVASTSAPITAAEWLTLAVAASTALGVYAVPNAENSAPKTGGFGKAKEKLDFVVDFGGRVKDAAAVVDAVAAAARTTGKPDDDPPASPAKRKAAPKKPAPMTEAERIRRS